MARPYRWICLVTISVASLTCAFGPGPVLALSQDEARAIAERVIALGDPEATRAFQELNEKGIFKVTDTCGDPPREIAFRILEQCDQQLSQGFTCLRSKGVFGEVLSQEHRGVLNEVRAAMAAGLRSLERANAQHELFRTRAIYFGDAKKAIKKEIDEAWINNKVATDRLELLKNRQEPEVLAAGKDLANAWKTYESWASFWNANFNFRPPIMD